MSGTYEIETSDFMEGWFMVRKAGERTEHFRTRDEAERYARSPTYREDVQRRSIPGSIGTNRPCDH